MDEDPAVAFGDVPVPVMESHVSVSPSSPPPSLPPSLPPLPVHGLQEVRLGPVVRADDAGVERLQLEHWFVKVDLKRPACRRNRERGRERGKEGGREGGRIMREGVRRRGSC